MLLPNNQKANSENKEKNEVFGSKAYADGATAVAEAGGTRPHGKRGFVKM